jgi:hypothetical protein
MIEKPVIASEGGHWYDRQGNPAYTIIGKNGQERPTTLRDARKLGLVPSVTTIIKCAAAPGLTNWMIDQAIMAALTLPRNDGENDLDFVARVKADSKAQAEKARERGTQIHAWVQAGFEEKYVDMEGAAYYQSANDTISNLMCRSPWLAEHSFSTDRYGGKCDIHNDEWIIDFKSTDKEVSGLKLWDEHYQQLAAYRKGLHRPGAQCGILYISSVTAESRIIRALEDDLVRGLRCFEALTDYFYAKTGLEAE